MKIHKILLLTALLGFVSCQQKPLKFVKLDSFSRVDTVIKNKGKVMLKTDCYIVFNYRDNLETEKSIDSFAYKNRATDLNKYDAYTIIVYKSSDITNLENLKKNPNDFDGYTFDNDMIFDYRWGSGTWSGKSKFKGRQIVDSSPMIRED